MSEKLTPPITIIIGPPGVGKTTLMEHVNSKGRFECHDGDEFISHEGNAHLSNGSWDDQDRVSYLSTMANFALTHSNLDKPLILVDAMTKVWMREHFKLALGNLAIAWVHASRELTYDQATQLVNFRAAQGHPIKNVDVFLRFHHEFDLLQDPHFTLKNPGNLPDFYLQIDKLLSDIYGH